MDRPVHLEASDIERSQFAYAARNSLRRFPAMIEIGEASDVDAILAAKAATASIPTCGAKGD